MSLTLSKHSHHELTRAWLEDNTARETIYFCRATQQGLLRLLTTSVVCAPYGIPALSNREAWSVYTQFTRNDRIRFASEPSGLEVAWKKLAAGSIASPKLWMDAYLAAFAMTGEMRLVTLDHGFAAFGRKGLELILLE